MDVTNEPDIMGGFSYGCKKKDCWYCYEMNRLTNNQYKQNKNEVLRTMDIPTNRDLKYRKSNIKAA
jgi:pyruvate formate-lyase activating enzyme-like uncharacterized protein